jgi:hypothetical protein
MKYAVHDKNYNKIRQMQRALSRSKAPPWAVRPQFRSSVLLLDNVDKAQECHGEDDEETGPLEEMKLSGAHIGMIGTHIGRRNCFLTHMHEHISLCIYTYSTDQSL